MALRRGITWSRADSRASFRSASRRSASRLLSAAVFAPAARPAARPGSLSSTTRHRSIGTASRCAASRKLSGSGLPAETSSEVTSTGASIPAAPRRARASRRSALVTTAHGVRFRPSTSITRCTPTIASNVGDIVVLQRQLFGRRPGDGVGPKGWKQTANGVVGGTAVHPGQLGTVNAVAPRPCRPGSFDGRIGIDHGAIHVQQHCVDFARLHCCSIPDISSRVWIALHRCGLPQPGRPRSTPQPRHRIRRPNDSAARPTTAPERESRRPGAILRGQRARDPTRVIVGSASGRGEHWRESSPAPSMTSAPEASTSRSTLGPRSPPLRPCSRRRCHGSGHRLRCVRAGSR